MKKFKLRNGAVVQAGETKGSWFTLVEIGIIPLDIVEDFERNGSVICLAEGGSSYIGGAYGSDYDIVEEIEE